MPVRNLTLSFFRCSVVLFVLLVAGARAATGHLDVEAQDDRGVILRWASPPPSTWLSDDTPAAPSARFEFPVGLSASRATQSRGAGEVRERKGMPAPRVETAWVAVPGPGEVHVRLLGKRAMPPRRLPVGFARWAQAERVRELPAAEDARGELHRAAAEAKAPVPGIVRVLGITRLRGQHMALLAFDPLQPLASGAWQWLEEVRVEVTFTDVPRRRPQPRTALHALHRLAVNARTAAHWLPPEERRGSRAASRALDGRAPAAGVSALRAPVAPQRLWLRFATEGIYALDTDLLRRAGVPVDDPTFDPRTLRLFTGDAHPIVLDADSLPASWDAETSREAALFVEGEADGRMDAGDRVLLYTLGPAHWEDRVAAGGDSLFFHAHPFDRYRHAWLEWGGPPGLRMDSVDVAAPAPLVDPVVTHATHRQHFEEELRFSDETPDGWYWAVVFPFRPFLTVLRAERMAGPRQPVAATLHLRVASALRGGVRGWAYAFDLSWGGQPQPTTAWLLGRDSPDVHDFFYTVQIDSADTLEVRATTDSVEIDGQSYVPTGRPLVIAADLAWERPLVAREGAWIWTVRPAASPQVYRIAGFTKPTPPQVFDVTDVAHPVRLVGITPDDSLAGSPGGARSAAAAGGWRFRHGRGAGVRTTYVATEAPHVPSLEDVELRDAPTLRERTAAPDLWIVTAPEFAAEAERLAAHRRTHFPGLPAGVAPDVLVSTTREIYDAFSAGAVDPFAIRNAAKFLYRLDAPDPRLRAVLLLGDASFDVRGRRTDTGQTWVPSVHAVPGAGLVGAADAIDDWLVEFDSPLVNFSARIPFPDVPIGRLPADSLAEAAFLVDRVIAYDTLSTPGPWTSRVLLTADDECTPHRCGEGFFIGGTESAADFLPAGLDVRKLYMTEFPLVQGQKPAAREAFIQAWTQGALMVAYQGHGAPFQLADEVLFLASDVPLLTNRERLPLFLAFSSRVAAFDGGPIRSMCERMLSSPVGGAVAAVAATGPTFAFPNRRLHENLHAALFPTGRLARVPLGEALLVAKTQIPTSLPNNLLYVLLGDPLTVLRVPEGTVRFTAGADTLHAGRRAHLAGFVTAPGDSVADTRFDGTAWITVRASADTSGYEASHLGGTFHLDYTLPGATLFEGMVPVVAGHFETMFPVPLRAGVREAGALGGVSAQGRGARPADPPGTVRNPIVRFGPRAGIHVYAAGSNRQAAGGRTDVHYVRRGVGAIRVAPELRPAPSAAARPAPDVTGPQRRDRP